MWQVAQLPGATPLWLKVAGVQALVLWQLSQAAVVGMWPDGLPLAEVPLWQVEQVPGATPLWSKRAPMNDEVLWQCIAGLPCGDMVVGHDGRCPRTAASMATRAMGWRSLEHAAHMAGFAAHFTVRATQGKPSLAGDRSVHCRKPPPRKSIANTANRTARAKRPAGQQPCGRGRAGNAIRFIVTLLWTRPGRARG